MRTRGAWKAGWLPPILGILAFATPAGGVTITEIHYHPSDVQGDLEFVELFNDRPVPRNLSGWSLSGGIDYLFPEGTALAGHAYIVVARDPGALRAAAALHEVLGPFEGRLANEGERITLANAIGAPVVSLRYADRYPWPDAADGTGHSLVLRDPWDDPADPASWRPSAAIGGSPGAPEPTAAVVERQEVLVRTGEVWRYRKGIDEPPARWRAVDFDDAGWAEGPTGIGYGDGDDATVLEDMRGAYLSVHARRGFTVAGPASVDGLVLRIDYDDGFVAYLNGAEIARAGLGDPGSPVPFDRRALPHEAGRPEAFEIPEARDLLQPGRNVLAIQVHNSTPSSSDLSLAPELIARIVLDPAAPAPFLLSEVGGLEAPPGEGFLEIRNVLDREADLSGTLLSDDPNRLDAYAVPAGTRVPAGGYVALAEDALPFSLRRESLELYLTRPDGRRVIDAAHIDGFPPGCARARLPAFGGRWLATRTPTPGAPNAVALVEDVVINEIAYHPMHDEEERGEYVELVNRSGRPVDLAGFRFSDGIAFDFPAGTVLEPGAYLVVGRDPDWIRSAYGIGNVLGPFEGRLENEGERIELADPLGNPADIVHYLDDDPWPKWADGLGSSLELRDPRADNASPLAWAASDESSRSRWETFTYEGTFPGGDPEFHMFLLGPGECLVDGIRLEAGTTQHLPNGSFEAGEAGWRFGGTHIGSHATEEDAADGAHALHLVATRRGDTRTNHVECETDPPIRAGRTYRLTVRARWLRGFDLLMTRTYNHGLARVHRLPVPERRGTPGGPNTALLENLGPTVRDVAQDPPAPPANAPVAVRARIGDPDGVAAAEIVWRRDGGGAEGRAPLADDGRGADEVAGDGVYAGTIPGLPARAIAAYWIETRDARGAASAWPREGEARPLLVQAGLPAPAGALPAYHVIMTEATRRDILYGDPWSNALRNAAFVLDGRRIFGNVGVRQRGCACSRGKVYPPLLRLRFREDQRFLGRASVNLDFQHADPSIQRDRAVDRILEVMGLPHARHRYVRVYLNGVFQKIYEDVERVDRLFVERYWPTDRMGALYKVDGWFELPDAGGYTWQPANFRWRGTDPEPYRFRFKNRGDEILDDYGPLIELVRRMDPGETPNDAFDGIAEQTIATREWIRAIAIRTAADAWDTLGVLAGKNAYLYQPVSGSPFFYIAFDNDATFGIGPYDVERPLLTGAFPGIRRFLSRPRYIRHYYAAFRELLDGPFSRRFLVPFFRANYEVLRAEVPSTPWPTDVLAFLDARRAYIASQLPSSGFRIVTNGGRPVETDEEAITIIGDAPLEAASFGLNGEPIELAFLSVSRWKLVLPLRPGENAFRFTAYDARGREIGAASITIFSNRPGVFLRGDANLDGGLDLADAIAILGGLFGDARLPCPDAADVDDDGRLSVADPIVLLAYLFAGGAAPAPPFPEAGLDRTEDPLGCGERAP